MEFEEAKKYIDHVIGNNVRDNSLQDKASMVVTSLSAIIQLASFVEKVVQDDVRFGKLAFGIYSSASSPGQSPNKKIFSLFGQSIDESREDFGEQNEEAKDVPKRNEEDRSEDDVRLATVFRGIESNAVLHGSSSAFQAMGVGCSQEFLIPERIVAKCMSYVLDCSGYTTHPRSCKVKDMDSVNAKTVVKAVKELFRSYKEVLKQQRVNAHGMQYGSMIPNHLRNKDVLVPNLILRRQSNGNCYKNDGVMKIKLPINKADRNKKIEKIAIIACFLHHDEHGVPVEDVMGAFVKKGFGIEGCKIFQKCSAARFGIPCKDNPIRNCSFYMNRNGEKIVVAKGTVDPFTTYLCGKEVSQSSLLIRMIELRELSLLGATEDDMEHDEFMRIPKIWPKKDITRVKILGEHGNEDLIGNGIMVATDLVHVEDRNVESMSICNAILLCDCSLNAEKAKEPFPFSEWYGNRLLKQLTECLGFIPQEMGDIMKSVCNVLIWHKALILS